MRDGNPPLHGLRLTLAFLTRIPVRHGADVRLDRMAPWFPVAGAAIGATAALALVGGRWAFGTVVGSVAAILVGVLVTGGFHHDGLADSADALVGGWSVQQRLEILKDPRHGTYGVLAIALQVVLQVAAVASLPTTGAAAAVALMHVSGRGAAVSVMRSAPGAAGGMGASYVAGVTRRDVATAVAVAAVLAATVAGWHGMVCLLASLAAARVVVAYAVRRIGGLVGDVLGAAEQVAESAALLGAVALVRATGAFGW